MDFDEAADDLYGGPPGDFVTRRSALAAAARSAGNAVLAKRIAALRRPTAPAWAVNRLAHTAAPELTELLEAGEGLRAAWATGADLAIWDRRRVQALAVALRRVTALAAEAGHPLSVAAQREAADTLEAATADPGTAAELRLGRLTKPRHHVGFALPQTTTAVSPQPLKPDVDDGTARPPDNAGQAHGSPTEDPSRQENSRTGSETATGAASQSAAPGVREELGEARMLARRLRVEADAATEAADEADLSLAEWTVRAEDAQAEVSAAEEAEARLRAELQEVLRRRQDAGRRARVAQRERDQAIKTAAAARRHAAEAAQRAEAAESDTHRP